MNPPARVRIQTEDFDLSAEVAALRDGDPAVLYALNDKVRDVLGWRSRYDDLRAIVETAMRWRLAHPGGYSGATR